MLLSIVASTVLFAGGDIAPVQPVAEAPAASCNDFYGAVAAGVIYDGVDNVEVRVGAILGVSREIFGGLVVNAEVQGATGLDFNTTSSTSNIAVEAGSLNALNLAYSFGNTAIMVGRWASSDTNYLGLKNGSYHEGIKLVNTDIADTTVTLAYAHYSAPIGTARVLDKTISGSIANTSFADTKITLGGDYNVASTDWDAYGIIDTKLMDADLSFGGKYYKSGAWVAGATVSTSFDAVAFKLGVSRSSTATAEFSKYTDFTGIDTTAAIGAKVSTKVAGFGIWAGGDYQVNAETWEASVGISKSYAGVSYAVDYRRNSAKANRVRAKAVYKF